MAVTPLTVSAHEAAAMLGVSDDLVYRLLDAGALPELPRVSRRWLIPRQAIELLVEHAMAGFDPAVAIDATVVDCADRR